MTIGFNHLGRHGRLGNQMFQYAGLRGIAAHKGYDFAIPPSDFNDEWVDHQLFEAFKLTGLTNIEQIPDHMCRKHTFISIRIYLKTCRMDITYMDIYKAQNGLSI